MKRDVRQRVKKNRYHEGRGKRLQRYGDGWTEDGREYYQLLLGIFKNLKSSDAWNTLQDYWKSINKKIVKSFRVTVTLKKLWNRNLTLNQSYMYLMLFKRKKLNQLLENQFIK